MDQSNLRTLSLELSSPEEIARKCLHDEKHFAVQLGQTKHRINLVNEWQILPGSRVLEIGCGQGDCTAVLASAVGASGHIDAIDPAPLSYGSPWTLGQAQSHLSSSDLGSRITWYQNSPVNFLDSLSSSKPYDVAVLAHCIWYFSTRTTLVEIAKALQGKTARICIAEYSLSASHPNAVPHVLAALAGATFEAHLVESTSNIQSVLSPREITSIFDEAGWSLNSSSTITPEADLLDGSWEVGFLASSEFLENVNKNIVEQRVRLVLRSMRDAILASMSKLPPGELVRTQDTWIANLAKRL
jgi:2-polyprenyl-3-methyl-5-hydroxy-6-metoxy-1,4-benzoquinol methylase